MASGNVIIAVSPSGRRVEITVRCCNKAEASCAKVTATVKEALEKRGRQVPETFPKPMCSDATGAEMNVRTMDLDAVVFPLLFSFRLAGAAVQRVPQTAGASVAPELQRRLAEARAARAELERQHRELRAALLEQAGSAAVAAVSEACEVGAPARVSPCGFRRPLSRSTTLCSIQEDEEECDREEQANKLLGKHRSDSLDSCSTRAGSELDVDYLCLPDAGMVC
jgi:hypothetical protein